MRTKTLLLSAAAMVAGLLSSQAQSNVYSANIVGYVSVTNAAGVFVLMANPLDNGTNNLTSLFPIAPNNSQIQVWNGSGFTLATKQLTGNWSTNLVILPGQGFFAKFPAAGTNTFVGSVAVPVGGSVTNSLAAGLFTLVGSPIPYTDTLTGTNLNLQVANNSQVQVWNGTGFTLATKQLTGNWSANLTITPGEGFFLKPSAATNWVQTLNVQ
jgi:hypothetical protein